MGRGAVRAGYNRAGRGPRARPLIVAGDVHVWRPRAKLREQKRAKEQLEQRRIELDKAQRAGDWVGALRLHILCYWSGLTKLIHPSTGADAASESRRAQASCGTASSRSWKSSCRMTGTSGPPPPPPRTISVGWLIWAGERVAASGF